MKIRSYLVAASLVASGGLVTIAAPAQAALTTTCVGEGGAVTVNGTLVVPAGASCTLTGTKVKGAVTIEAGADLVAKGVTFNSTVAVGDNAYLDITDSTVKGAVTEQGAFGVHVQNTEAGGGISAVGGFLYSVDATVKGDVRASSGELYISGTTVSGAVSGDANLYTDVYDSTVGKTLTVKANTLGGVLCASEVEDDTVYQNNSDTLQLGGDGPLSSCAQATYLGGDLAVTGNNANAVLDNTIVRGKLTASDNSPALQVGELARIRGGIAATTTAPSASLARTAKAAPQDRGADLAAKAAARTEQAEAAAAAAGTGL
ncbi:hypothetical protein ACFWVC_22050 [Streptomyces sp. NPDC058691]|uniref:hypothetical protein n=1 Tax=Streptomyces sp. NPDC058691 TaxID=3346601 RepID=UPI00365AB969